jgi:GTPase
MAYAIIRPNGDAEFVVGIPDTGRLQEICGEGFSQNLLEPVGQVRILNDEKSAYIARADVWINDRGVRDTVGENVNLVATRLCKDHLGSNTYLHGNAVIVGRANRGGDTVSLSPLIQERIIEVLGEQ